MKITQKMLKAALDRLEPWRAPDYRKNSHGRIVRYVDWKKKISK